MDKKLEKQVETFAEAMNLPPDETAGRSLLSLGGGAQRPLPSAHGNQLSVVIAGFMKIQLLEYGQPIGWLGRDGHDWCTVVSSKNDAIQLAPYLYETGGVFGTSGGDNGLYLMNPSYSNSYLSVSNNKYLGLYPWDDASKWAINRGVMVSEYFNLQLSYYSRSDNFVYAYSGSGYTPLTVKLFSS